MSSVIRTLPPQPFAIRDAQAEDAESIAQLARDLAAFEEVGESAFTAEHFLRYGCGASASFHVIIAEQSQDGASAIAGFLMYYTGFDLASASHGSHLADVFVKEAARGAGIGRSLIGELARRTLAAGGSWVSWTVLKKNRAAKKFYTDLGASNVAVDFMAWGESALKKLAS